MTHNKFPPSTVITHTDPTCLRENTRPERSEDTSRAVTVVLESTESIQEVVVMLEVNITTEF